MTSVTTVHVVIYLGKAAVVAKVDALLSIFFCKALGLGKLPVQFETTVYLLRPSPYSVIEASNALGYTV